MAKLQPLTSSDQDKVNILNTIRDGVDEHGNPLVTDEYRNSVPVATLANIRDVGNPIINYTLVTNQFLSVLINKIAFTYVHNRSFVNPLRVLKKGGVPLGYDIEEIMVNPAEAKPYSICGTDVNGDATEATDGLFECAKPDVKVAYHRLNRQDKYKVRIARPLLEHAFTNWVAFGNFVDAIINSLYNGDEIDEFNLTKQMIGDAVSNQRIIEQVVGPVTDEASAKNLIRAIRTDVLNFQIPSSSFNAWAALNPTDTPAITWVNSADDLVLLVRNDVLGYVDVDVLASAFNLSYTEFLGNKLSIDSFGPDASNVLAVLVDKAWTQIYDNRKEMTDWFSPSALYWDYWLHHWQTYSYSPMANAKAYVETATPDPTPTP